MMQEMCLSSIISDVSREYYPIAFFSSPFHIFIKLILHQIQWRPKHFDKWQLTTSYASRRCQVMVLVTQHYLTFTRLIKNEPRRKLNLYHNSTQPYTLRCYA